METKTTVAWLVAAVTILTAIGLHTLSNGEERESLSAVVDSLTAEFVELREREELQPDCGLQLGSGPFQGVEEVLTAVRAKPSRQGVDYLAARLVDLGRIVDSRVLNSQLLCSFQAALSRDTGLRAAEAHRASASLDSVLNVLKPSAENPWRTYDRFRTWYDAQSHNDLEALRRDSRTALHLSEIEGATPGALYALSQNITLRPNGPKYSVQYTMSDSSRCSWKWFLNQRWGHRRREVYTDVSGGVFTFRRGPISVDRRTCRAPVPTRRGLDRPLPSLMRQLKHAMEKEVSTACRALVNDPPALTRLFESYRPGEPNQVYDNASKEAQLEILATGEEVCRMRNSSVLAGVLAEALATSVEELVGPQQRAGARVEARGRFVIHEIADALVSELASGPYQVDMVGGAR